MASTTGALIGAGGQIAGGILAAQGGLNAGDFINVNYDPTLNPGLQGSLTDALQLIGRGDIYSEPDPFQQLVGRIQGLAIDEKSKRRALHELQQYQAGEPMSWNGTFLDAGFSRLGVTRAEIDQALERAAEFKQKQARLAESGFSGLEERVLLDRMAAAKAASGALRGAAGFATGGEVGELGNQLRERDNRNLADLKDKLGVMANFGNINPGTAFEQIIDRQLDQNLRLLQESIGVSQALTGGVGAGTGVAAGAATGQSNAIQNAASMAAQQAAATNQIRNQTSLDNALSLANGVSGAANTLNNAADTQTQLALSMFGGGGMGGGGAAAGGSNYAGGQRIGASLTNNGSYLY